MRVHQRLIPLGALALTATVLAAPSSAQQTYSKNTTNIPSGNPGNNSFSENIGFADIDLDGDYDAFWADGGDCCNDRNRLWINQGGLQGGTMGVFVDDTNARTPSGTDDSRDVDFVDFDHDGDQDVYVSNTSTNSNQGNRFLINQGGIQGGTAGFFTDETSTRWVNIGVNGPSTSSSLPLSQKIVGGTFDGSFVDWSCDCVFGDLDNDGDQDLVHTTYGGNFNGDVPSRLFLNNGSGFFEEFNPSDFQLSGTDLNPGDPALWAEGVQQPATTNFDGSEADIADSPLGVEIGDLNGNFDIDILQGARNEYPRMYWNLTSFSGGGTLNAFRDVSENVMAQKAFGGGNYEQELGDFDNDNDLDVYGLNWAGTFSDIVMTNNGSGFFSAFTVLSGSGTDDNEGEFTDYDNDGDLDLYVGNFLGQDRLYRNNGAGGGYSFTNVPGQLPSLNQTALGVESADTDFDGDTDLMVGNDNGAANYYLINLTNIPDTTAPRVVLEQMPDRLPSATPTRVRAKVFDNSSWDINGYATVEIEYTVNAGPPQTSQMFFGGGQNFSGTIPGTATGTISYFVRATDDHGNTGTSGSLQFVNGGPENYCTAGTSANGCQALISANGTPSATAASGFTLDTASVEGQKDGLYFFAANGRQANSWGSGTSFQCVAPPVFRGGLLLGNGTVGACDGTFSQDMNARWQAKPNSNPGAGAVVQAQLWYRDPQNTSNQTTSLSDAVEFTVQP